MTLLQEQKNKRIMEIFHHCSCPKEVYKKIITIGQSLAPFDSSLKTNEARVFGCQSLMYLSCKKNACERLEFRATSDALISKGLAAIMLEIYNFETPESILKININILQEIHLFDSLSPNRINGMRAFYIKLISLAKSYLVD